MSQHKHYETAPEDRISLSQKLIYGAGAFVNNLLAQAIAVMAIVLNLGLGMNPALVGLLGALPRLTDALTDPLMGYISDHTKSKWGRRRPYILIGAIAAGIVFALLWQLPRDESEMYVFWFFLAGSILFYLAYTVFATPWVALGYELTPDYHERTRLMAVQNVMGQFALLLAPWFLLFMQHDSLFGGDMITGAAWLAVIIGVTTICIGILPAILLREPGQDRVVRPHIEEEYPASIMDFFRGFLVTIKFQPFLCLCLATFLVFNGFMLVQTLQNYVIIYYVFGGDQSAGAEYIGWVGTTTAVATFCAIFITSWLSTKIGKRRAFFFSTGISIVGYALKWFCYTPENPLMLLVPAPLIAFGLGGLFTLMASMNADVCDMDEVETHQRREGMFGSIFWWVVKLGLALALALSGFLLNATGFNVDLGGAQTQDTLTMMRLFDAFVPFTTSAIAIWVIYKYPITEEKAYEIRALLEARKSGVEPEQDGEALSPA